MKRILIFFILSITIYANQKDIYLNYTYKIINYHFKLKDLNKIKTPFYKPHKYVYNNEKKQTQKIEIELLSIFNNKALVIINKYINEELISTKKVWLKKNDKIENCKLIKITDTEVYFNCNNKILYKTLNIKIPKIRDK